MSTYKMDSPIKLKKRKLMQKSGKDSSWSEPLVMAAPVTSVSNDQDLFNKVFTNDLVWKTLGSYLNLDDLKDCRLTCQLFNTKIMDLKSFRDRARLNIPLSKFPAADLEKTRVNWRHLAINVDLGQKDTSTENWWDSSQDSVPNISQLLSSIISLKLYRTNYCSFRKSPEVPETFSKILPMMTNIQKISIDMKIFEKIRLSWFARASASLMSKVKEFHLECKVPNEDVPNKVTRLSTRLPLGSVHLEDLRIGTLIWAISNSDRIGPIFRILAQNQNNLRTFQVKDPQLWTKKSADEFGTLPKLPQLKVLKLRIVTEENIEGFFSEAHLIQFFTNQPEHLEEIDLVFRGSIPSAVFRILRDRAMSFNLKVLRIKMYGSYQTTPSDMEKWNFLHETNLQEFSFQLKAWPAQLSNKQLKDFFGALPKSAKTLSVTGVMQTGWQPPFNLKLSKCFDPKVLTHLNLRRCEGLLKDSVLQEIWKSFKNLQTLNLSECGNNCTDWGFTGVPAGAEPQGVAISLLKGLKSLTLESCNCLTDRTLIDGIRFQELQFLDLKNNNQFTKSGFLAVIRQNPSLQTFVTEHDHESHPDLPTHLDHDRQIRSVKISSRLTRELHLDYDCDSCDCDEGVSDYDSADSDDFDTDDSDDSDSDDSESDDDSDGKSCHGSQKGNDDDGGRADK